ncbi:MAG: hypothetical protein V1489_00270 [Candidatus Liptonbacteria bacterium]
MNNQKHLNIFHKIAALHSAHKEKNLVKYCDTMSAMGEYRIGGVACSKIATQIDLARMAISKGDYAEADFCVNILPKKGRVRNHVEELLKPHLLARKAREIFRES